MSGSSSPSSPSTSGEGRADGRHHQLHQPRADRRQRTVHRDEFEKGTYLQMDPQPLLLRQAPGASTRSSSRPTEPRHHDHRPQVGQPRRRVGHPGGPVRRARVSSRARGARLSLLQLGVPELQLLREPQLPGRSRAQGLAVPQRASTTRSIARSCARSPSRAMRRRARRSCRRRRGTTPTTTGSRRRTRSTRFDLAKAGQLLDEAGYPLKGGQRVDRQGQPIVAAALRDDRQRAVADRGQAHRRLVRQLGINVQFSVLDAGALLARVWNFEGDAYAPDFDMYIDSWLGYVDPGETLTGRDHAARSAAPTSRAGRTRSTTSSPTSRRRSWTPSSASRPSGGCSRSCTSRRRGSSSRTRTSSRRTTPRTGQGGRA